MGSRYPLQETIDQDSINSSAIRITSGVFYVWRSAGLVTGDSLFVAALAKASTDSSSWKHILLRDELDEWF